MSAQDDADKDPATDDEAGPEEETASDEPTDDTAADTTEPEAEAEAQEPTAASTGPLASVRSWLQRLRK